MALVHFTVNLQRHVDCPTRESSGATVAEVLGDVFAKNPRLRGYVVDEHGALRKHVAVFVDGRQVADRDRLSDLAAPTSEIYVMQALSGGR